MSRICGHTTPSRSHPGHGRILLAELTPAGQAVLGQGLGRADAVGARLLDPLDATVRRLLLDFPARVADAQLGPSSLPRRTIR